MIFIFSAFILLATHLNQEVQYSLPHTHTDIRIFPFEALYILDTPPPPPPAHPPPQPPTPRHIFSLYIHTHARTQSLTIFFFFFFFFFWGGGGGQYQKCERTLRVRDQMPGRRFGSSERHFRFITQSDTQQLSPK